MFRLLPEIHYSEMHIEIAPITIIAPKLSSPRSYHRPEAIITPKLSSPRSYHRLEAIIGSKLSSPRSYHRPEARHFDNLVNTYISKMHCVSEITSSDTLNVKRLKSKIFLKYMGARKPKGQNKMSKID